MPIFNRSSLYACASVAVSKLSDGKVREERHDEMR